MFSSRTGDSGRAAPVRSVSSNARGGPTAGVAPPAFSSRRAPTGGWAYTVDVADPATMRRTPPPSTAKRTVSPRLVGAGPSSAPTAISGRNGGPPLPIPRGTTSAQQQQQLVAAGGPPVYTVGNMPTAGSLFVAITRALLARGDWVLVEPQGLAEVKAGPMPGGKGSINPCCSKLRGVNLFMGEKTLAEKLMAESRIVGLRRRRPSASASARGASSSGGGVLSCTHARRAVLPPNMAASPDDNLVNYLEGSRGITMKSRMVRTLVAYYQRRPQLRPMRSLHEYLPVTFILTPLAPSRRLTPAVFTDEREAMIDAMKTANDDDPNGTVSSWIAKCSNGCHGDGIKIVRATAGGLRDLLAYIDGFSDGISWVVCRYIDRPLLYRQRKFDLRVWVLLMEDGRVYMHRDLVMRLSSVPYNPALITTDTKEGRLANITNHCIQTTSDTYGVDEAGNELWWDSLQRLLLETAAPRRQQSHYSGGGGGASSSAPSPPRSPQRVPPPRGGGGGGLDSLPADEAAILQMQRIIVESFAATKEAIAAEKGMLTGTGERVGGVLSAVSPSAAAAASAVGGSVVGGMPALPSGVIPYPTLFTGVGTAATATAAVPQPSVGQSRPLRGGGASTPPPPPNASSPAPSSQSQQAPHTTTNATNATGTGGGVSGKVGCDSFHIFGYDFLIDEAHRVWLLEINGSPGVADKLLRRIVDDTIETAIDPRFPPLFASSAHSRSRSVSPQRVLGGGPAAAASAAANGSSPLNRSGGGGLSPPQHSFSSSSATAGGSLRGGAGAGAGGARRNGYELIYGPGVNKAAEYYRLLGGSGKGFE